MLPRILLLLCSILAISVAREQFLSPIPPPSQEVVKLDTKQCGKSCLEELFYNDYPFSFMANFLANPKAYKDEELTKKFKDLAAEILDFTPDYLPKVTITAPRIALLIPQKSIGRYSASSADSILAYLITRGVDFSFKVFDSVDESPQNLSRTYSEIEKQGFDYAVAIITSKGLESLLANSKISIPLFVPTVSKAQISQDLPIEGVVFGGLDYGKQISMLVNLAASKQAGIISYNDDSPIGRMLGELVASRAQNLLSSEAIDSKKAAKFSDHINKARKNLKTSIVILNTSANKSGVIVPQIGSAKLLPIAFLSPQVNYNPYLLRLLQKEDAKKIFVVSAIGSIPPNLIAFSDLLSADLQYDWVNYATALAIDLMLEGEGGRLFTEVIEDQQVLYNDRFYGIRDGHFVPMDPR